MRTRHVVLAALLCGAAAGCQSVENFLNPPAQSGDTRVTDRLRSLPPPVGPKKIITVYKFKNKTKWKWGLRLSSGMTDMLITALVNTGHFRVVERERLDEILKEKDLITGGDATGPADKKKILGAALIVAGAVTELDQKDAFGFGYGKWKYGFRVRMVTASVGLDLRVYDAATSEVLAAIPIRKTVRRTGISGHYKWARAGVKISNALDQAARECIEEAVYRLVMQYGAR